MASRDGAAVRMDYAGRMRQGAEKGAVAQPLVTPRSGIDPARWWLRRYDRDYVAYEWTGIVYYAVRFGVVPVV